MTNPVEQQSCNLTPLPLSQPHQLQNTPSLVFGPFYISVPTAPVAPFMNVPLHPTYPLVEPSTQYSPPHFVSGYQAVPTSAPP